jgi:hypothetical protein
LESSEQLPYALLIAQILKNDYTDFLSYVLLPNDPLEDGNKEMPYFGLLKIADPRDPAILMLQGGSSEPTLKQGYTKKAS